MKKRVISFILALAMVCSLLPGTVIGAAAAEADSYTYNSYVSSLPGNWNPHTWETSSASAVLELLSTPMVAMSISDSANGIYQWVYLAAESVTDVTADHQDDLAKYGADSADATSGYVFDIALNPDMKWQDGTAINADTYVYSMEQLLDPQLQNYRANTYYSGEAAIAGAKAYFFSGSTEWQDLNGNVTLDSLVADENGVYFMADGSAVCFGLTSSLSWLGGNSLNDYVEAYGEQYFDMEAYSALYAMADENGNVPVTDESIALMTAVISVAAWGEGPGYEHKYLVMGYTYPETTYDTVGLYKVDDYTIRYVTQSYIDINYLLTSLTSNWLVHEGLYGTGSYGTSVDTTMSYGPYMLETADPESQFVLVQNPNHFEYTENADGSLSSVTEFLVDGQNVTQWQTTKIVYTVMDSDSAKAAFLAGQLDDWAPAGDDLVTYAASDRLYKVDETYTPSLFFNTDLEALQAMDTATEYTNANSVVMSNENFRKAFSLSIDRADWVLSTSGYKPAFTLMNSLYFYDIYNDPASSYRNSEQAMAAVCDLYGVDYTDETLEDAYNSITGYDLAQAKALMAQACSELVAAGLYTEGEDITIHIAYTSGTLASAHGAQIAKLNTYINAAAEGSGFGTITLVGDSGVSTYDAVGNGTHAIGYGAWGGAPFYPFRIMQLYCDPDMYWINEGNCWDPTTETLTITIDGEDVTMTWQEWSRACVSGAYRSADFDTKLTITAALEAGFLGKYYRIPLAGSCQASMMSYQVDYYTDTYNIMYGFGGLRLMRYNYTDSQWDAYVASGDLSYGGSDDSGEDEAVETAFVGNSLSLNGDIGVNFYTTLSDEFLADENAHIQFTVNGVTQGYSMDYALADTQEDGSVWYRFSQAMPAKGMADTITAQLWVSDGSVGESKTYSVAQYYTDICQKLDREEKADLFALIEAMLNYGAASQEYFGYNTESLANAAVTTAVPEAVDASAYAHTVSDNDALLSYAGMSLVLESNTVLRVFFRTTSGADISGRTFTVDGQTATPVQRGSLWYIELSNIAAKELDSIHTFTAGDVTVQCSALSYVNSVLSKADTLDAKLVAVCKALYAYNEAANAYFTE